MRENEKNASRQLVKKAYCSPQADLMFQKRDIICSSDPYMHDLFDKNDFLLVPGNDPDLFR